jgi:hypothetical protein
MEDRKVMVRDPETGEMKEMTISFAPGCFDGLLEDGVSVDEMNELIEKTIELFASGKAFEDAVPLDPEDMELLVPKNVRH